jgi:hypothetical protein
VIDANVIIKQIRLKEMMGVNDDKTFDSLYEVHTIQEVLEEIRDDLSRNYLKNLPYALTVHNSDEKIEKPMVIAV